MPKNANAIIRSTTHNPFDIFKRKERRARQKNEDETSKYIHLITMTMGNLLNTPITEKDTHVGRTVDQHSDGGGTSGKKENRNSEAKRDSEAPTPSIDGGGLHFGISGMQGYRKNMEDAHVAQPFLFAEEIVRGGEAAMAISSFQREEMDAPFANDIAKGPLSGQRFDNDDNDAVRRIVHPLPNHSLFAIFDGHGGTFASDCASRNFLRILSRNFNFVSYALGWNGREEHLERIWNEVYDSFYEDYCGRPPPDGKEEMRGGMLKGRRTIRTAKATTKTTTATTTAAANRKKKWEYKCDKRVRAIRDQMRRCFEEDDEDKINDGVHEEQEDDDESTSDNPPGDHIGEEDEEENEDSVREDEWHINDRYLVNSLSYDCWLKCQLERALRDAFLDLDAELLAQMRGDNSTSGRAKDANTPYGAGYELNALLGCSSTTGIGNEEGGGGEYCGVGHVPREFGSDDAVAATSTMEDEANNNNRDDPSKSSSMEFNMGSTAVVVLITPKWIVCANAGDSRAVYSRSSHQSVPLSYDHKPSDEAEERRIRKAGGYVDGGRIEGDLAVSRGLGDYRFKELDVVATGARGENRQEGKRGASAGATARGRVKDAPKMRPSEQKVSSLPDVIVQCRDPEEDEFIVLACDGVWDVQTNQECVRMVAELFAEGESDMGLVCEEILDQCLVKGSKDNMTVEVIKFPKQAIGKGRGVIARRERRRASSSLNASTKL